MPQGPACWQREPVEGDLTRADGSPLRVLVVDDEVNIAELVGMALRHEGWETSVAHTGRAAVSAAMDGRPDAVVLDMMLPDFDGMEVLRRIRAHLPRRVTSSWTGSRVCTVRGRCT